MRSGLARRARVAAAEAGQPVRGAVEPVRGIVVDRVNDTTAIVEWPDSNDDEEDYEILRSTTAAFDPKTTERFAVGHNVNRYRDAAIKPDVAYHYQVRAFNDFSTTEMGVGSVAAGSTALVESQSDVTSSGETSGAQALLVAEMKILLLGRGQSDFGTPPPIRRWTAKRSGAAPPSTSTAGAVQR